MLGRYFGLLVVSIAGSCSGLPAHAEDPPVACVVEPDAGCLLAWAKDEIEAAMSTGAPEGRVLDSASIIAQDLLEANRPIEAVELVKAIPDAAIRELVFQELLGASHSIASEPAFKQALLEDLATGWRAPAAQSLFWPDLIKLAGSAGYGEEANAAFLRAVDAIRSGTLDQEPDKDAKIRAVIEGALAVNNLAVARELVERMTDGEMIKRVQWDIANAEKGAFLPGPRPSNPSTATRLNPRMSSEQLHAALKAASTPGQYVTVALEAAMAGDKTVASDAVENFAQLPKSSMAPMAISCELKAGFVHQLLGDDYDLDGLIRDVEAQRNEMRDSALDGSFGGLFWWFTSWNEAALKILRGDKDPIPRDLPEDTPYYRAMMIGGSAAVAMGIGDRKAVPFMRDAMRQVPGAGTAYERATLLEVWGKTVVEHTVAGDLCGWR